VEQIEITKYEGWHKMVLMTRTIVRSAAESVVEEVGDARRVTSTPCENESSGADDGGHDTIGMKLLFREGLLNLLANRDHLRR
jgi:hypothetical protein